MWAMWKIHLVYVLLIVSQVIPVFVIPDASKWFAMLAVVVLGAMWLTACWAYNRSQNLRNKRQL